MFGELVVELGGDRLVGGKAQLDAAGGQRGIPGRRRAVDEETCPGSAWKRAASVGSLTQSCRFRDTRSPGMLWVEHPHGSDFSQSVLPSVLAPPDG
jgi:hypothetical protein